MGSLGQEGDRISHGVRETEFANHPSTLSSVFSSVPSPILPPPPPPWSVIGGQDLVTSSYYPFWVWKMRSEEEGPPAIMPRALWT